jgi:hypothetical protein
MRKLDRLLCASQRWVRARSLLYRLTLGTRLLLAVGFIPTGMVKLLVLSNATATAGAMLFFGIMLNVFGLGSEAGEAHAPVPRQRLGGAPERGAYVAGTPDVTVQSLAGVGHDFNTHFRNHEGRRLMDDWLRSGGLGR